MVTGKRDDPFDVRYEITKPFSLISIETGSECNRRCAFCPVSHNPRPDEWMPDAMFDKILDDLVLMNYKKRMMLYSYNEPMREPRLIDMVKIVRERLHRVSICINTNGDYIKERSDVNQLFLAGMNQMQINIYSKNDGCGDPEKIALGIEKAKKRYAELKDMIDSMHWLDQDGSVYQYKGPSVMICQVVPKWDFQPPTHHDGDLPTRKHGVSIRHHIANRAGNIQNFLPIVNEPLEKMCIRPFRAMNINWRGDTMLCCNDYHAAASSGNVMDRSLVELWNDKRWHAYRIKLQAKDRNIYLCDVCDYAGGFYQHNVPFVTMGDPIDAKIIYGDLKNKTEAGF